MVFQALCHRARRPFSIFVQVPHLGLLSVLQLLTCVLGSCVTSFHLLLSYATLLFICGTVPHREDDPG